MTHAVTPTRLSPSKLSFLYLFPAERCTKVSVSYPISEFVLVWYLRNQFLHIFLFYEARKMVSLKCLVSWIYTTLLDTTLLDFFLKCCIAAWFLLKCCINSQCIAAWFLLNTDLYYTAWFLPKMLYRCLISFKMLYKFTVYRCLISIEYWFILHCLILHCLISS